MIVYLIIFSLIFSLEGNELGPWGKDSDLVSSLDVCSKKITGHLSEKLILFHQKVISPADGPRSHFIPSSSQYTMDAMNKYGFLKGFIKGCDRLMRENSEPWVYPTVTNGSNQKMKWDPA